MVQVSLLLIVGDDPHIARPLGEEPDIPNRVSVEMLLALGVIEDHPQGSQIAVCPRRRDNHGAGSLELLHKSR